jgi:hypothetical protein
MKSQKNLQRKIKIPATLIHPIKELLWELSPCSIRFPCHKMYAVDADDIKILGG